MQDSVLWARLPSVDLMAFTEKLAELRRAKGLPQNDLAAMVGLNQAQIHRYEKGAAEPSISALNWNTSPR